MSAVRPHLSSEYPAIETAEVRLAHCVNELVTK